MNAVNVFNVLNVKENLLKIAFATNCVREQAISFVSVQKEQKQIENRQQKKVQLIDLNVNGTAFGEKCHGLISM